jgi:hypothetical protein
MSHVWADAEVIISKRQRVMSCFMQEVLSFVKIKKPGTSSGFFWRR